MEQKVFNKFNLYDQIGYIMVGATAQIIFCFNVKFFTNNAIPEINVSNFIVWFIIAYFFGHFIQSFSNVLSKIPLIKYLFKENKTDFNSFEKEILLEAKKYFKMKTDDFSRIWNVCYQFCSTNDNTGQIQSFNSNYGLYRGWLVLFILNQIFLCIQIIKNYTVFTLLIFCVNLIVLFVFQNRMKRFWNYFRDKVINNFIIVLSKEKE